MESVQPATIAKESLLTTVWALTGTATAFFLTRLAIRKKFTARFWLDDWISAAATGFLVAQSLITSLMANSMYETLRYSNTRSKLEQDMSPLSRTEAFMPAVQTFMRAQFAQSICFWTCIYLVKASFLTLSFRLLPNHLRPFTIAWCILAGLTALFYVVSVISFPIACSVLSPPFCSGGHSINLSQVSLQLSTALDIITNLLIIALPIALAFRANFPPQTKITLIAIFSSIILILIMSIFRLSQSDGEENNWPEVTALNLWSAIEAGIAVIVVNVAEFKLLFNINQTSRPHSSYPPLTKARISTLPPTIRDSSFSPTRQSQAALSPPIAMTPRDARDRISVVPYRPMAIEVPYTQDPGPRTYSPPMLSDVSNPVFETHLEPPSSSIDGSTSRRWSNASSRAGMEGVVISHALDDLDAEITAQNDILADEPNMSRKRSSVDDQEAQRDQGPSLHESPDDVDEEDEAGEHDLIIQGGPNDSDTDGSDEGLENYDLGGLSYYLPATPEAPRASFYNL